MNEVTDRREAREPETEPAVALALGAASRDKADSFLEEQTRLVHLQAEELLREERVRHWSSRVHHISALMKLAFELGLAFIVLAIAMGLAAAIWSASRADGIVVDSFSVPPQFAAAGIAGDVVADDLTNRIALVRDTANKFTFTSTKDVRNDRDEAIKVDIPDTGISLSQIWRMLRGWLGHERHLSGNLRMVGSGKIVLTIVLQGVDAMTFTGGTGELARLEQQAAEEVYAKVDPGNYVLYLHGTGHPAEALAAAARLVQVTKSGDHAYSLWANETRHNGDPGLSLKRALIAISLDPKLAVGPMEAMFDDEALGHNEAALEQANAILKLKVSDQPASQQDVAFPSIISWASSERDMDTGDFGRLSGDGCPFCTFAQEQLSQAEVAARMHDGRGSRALIAEALAAGSAPATDVARAQYFSDAAVGNWTGAKSDARAWLAASANSGRGAGVAAGQHIEIAPWLAIAQARAGDVAGAHATISGTPMDCYECLRARGQISALEKDWRTAQTWFHRAVAAAPSISFAYADWGAMLLRKGDVDGAIAKFETAHAKGPHFADPLEMWGEALMQRNRSDLALAKFEEANTYAPNWGSLHLKWGEALMYAGKKDEAQKQFAVAARLDLSPGDAEALQRIRAKHV